MAAAKDALLYDRMVEITADYLGPAAPRFIDRQIYNHLKKAPADIEKDDLKELIAWIRAAISILTDDYGLVDEFASRLENIGANADNTL
jgi:hypothetical protein